MYRTLLQGSPWVKITPARRYGTISFAIPAESRNARALNVLCFFDSTVRSPRQPRHLQTGHRRCRWTVDTEPCEVRFDGGQERERSSSTRRRRGTTRTVELGPSSEEVSA